MSKKLIFIFLICLPFITISANSNIDSIPANTDKSLFEKVENWYENNINYASITVLMAAESSILPVPSEMVIPPAVYIATKPGGDLSIFLIIVFGTIGALIGASFNYFMSMWLGRIIIYKFADSRLGKLLLLSSDKIKKSEKFFNDHGKTSTFIGRLIPVVRHLISIPAGLAKMNYLSFLFYTFLGAGLWNIILAALGYFAGENRDLINTYSHEFSYLFLLVGVIMLIWLIIKSSRKKKTV